MHRPFLTQALALALALLAGLSAVVPVQAFVDLAYFEVVPGTSATELIVRWGTETETGTAGFRIKRGVTSDMGQAQDIHTEPARGSATTGSDYEYIDRGLTAGQLYYYWLVELTTTGQQMVLDSTSATAGGSGQTQPTATTPAQATPTAPPPTPTSPPPTATPPLPTATLAPTWTPVVAAGSSQPTPVPTDTPPAQALPALTPVPFNPTAATQAGEAPPPSGVLEVGAAVAATAAAESALRGALPGEIQPASDLTALPEDAAPAEPAGADLGQPPAAAPQSSDLALPPASDPAQQAQLVRPTATPRPDVPAGNSDNAASLLLVVGAGSFCGAALLVLVVLFVWRRR